MLKILLRKLQKIAALWKEEAKQTVHIFVRPTLPWSVGMCEVDRRVQLLLQLTELRELRAVIASDGSEP